MAVQDYKINYKSDFVLTINGDAGWATQFCIKFWTGMPSQAYFVGFDGVKYVNCRVGDTPTQLLVMFDDHHLPIGKLMMQIAYHTTIEEFPGSVFDEVTNARDVIVTIDGTDYQVMLDFTGEDAPELEFDLPAYANEAERIQNELQRQQNEADRIAAELQREQATAAAVQGAENVNAQLNGTTLTVTNRQGVSTSVNTKGEQGEQGPVGPEGPQGEQGVSITGLVKTGETETDTLYNVTFSDGTTQAVAIPKGEKGDRGPVGPQGQQGQTGVSITGLVKTGETETDTLYNITFSNGTTQQVAIPKGEKGDQGPAGPQGPQGPMGDVAVITPEQQAAFTMYSEPGQNTDGPMTQKAVTDNLVASAISYDNSQSGLAANNVQGALDDIGKWNVSQRNNYDWLPYGFNGTKITTISGYKGFILKVKEGEVYWFDKSITNYSFFVNIPANNSTTSSWHAGILAGTAAVVTDNTANYMYVTVPSSYTEIVVYKREDVQSEIEDVRDNISYSRSLSNFSPYGFNGAKITTLRGYKGFILEVKEGEVYSFDKGLANYAFFVNIPANNSTASSWHAAIYANTKVVVTDADARYMYVTVANSVSEIEITKYGNYDIRITAVEDYLEAVQDVLPTVTPILNFSTYAFNGTKITTLSGYLGFILEVNYGEVYWFDKNAENYAFFANEPVLNSTPISWHVGILAGTRAVVTEPDANYMFVTIKTDVDSINVSKANQYDTDIESLKKDTYKLVNERVMAGSATNIPIVVLIYDDATNNDHLLIEKCDARGLKATLAIPYDISPGYESNLITWLNNGHGIIGHSLTAGMDNANDAVIYAEMDNMLAKINTLGQSCHGFAYYGSTTAEYPHNRRILSKYWDYCWKYHRGKPVNTPSTDVYDLDRGSTDYLNYIDGYKQLILDNLGKNCVIAFGGHMTRTGTGTSQYCTMAYFEQFLDMLQWFVDNKLVVSMNAEDAMKEYFKRTNNACIVKASSLYNPVVGQQKMDGNSILTCTNAGTCAYYQMAISGTPSSGQIKLSIDGYNGSQTITINTTSGQTINDVVNAFVNSVYKRYTVRKVSDGIVGLFCDIVGVANTPSITSNTSGLTITISQIVEGSDSIWV